MRDIHTDEVLLDFDGCFETAVKRLEAYLYGRRPLKALPAEQAEERFYELLPLFQAQAPSGYFFGQHPKHPASIGYWPNELS